ncbi:hypothetical protein F183_A21350 [Bryobacterales bacterium F-183]|nr:hypothetical protein F183_A21350 [Bryobacterales bacterium F-183]
MDVILNSMGKVGNKMRNAVVRSNSQVKHVENFASYLTSITMELAIGNASIFQKMGGRLLQTEDKPVVELIPSQPALQELQENALKAGLNPAWLRLEGLASLYIFHRDRMMEAIITTAEAATGLVKVINGVQTKDTTRLIRKNIKLVRDMSREIDRGRHTVDSYCSMQARPGFPSDMVWVDFIVTSATTYSTVVTDYSNVLVVLEESCANADLPWFGTVTLKAYLAEVRHLKSAVTAYAQSLQMFIDWISAVDTDASELT